MKLALALHNKDITLQEYIAAKEHQLETAGNLLVQKVYDIAYIEPGSTTLARPKHEIYALDNVNRKIRAHNRRINDECKKFNLLNRAFHMKHRRA